MLVSILLPFPPTVNTYFTVSHGRKILSDRGRTYQAMCAAMVDAQRRHGYIPNGTVFTDDVAVEITIRPPDRRKRDLDNLLKAALDAITNAHVWNGDSQVKQILARWGERTENGSANVKIMALDEVRIDEKEKDDM